MEQQEFLTTAGEIISTLLREQFDNVEDALSSSPSYSISGQHVNSHTYFIIPYFFNFKNYTVIPVPGSLMWLQFW